MCSVFSQPVGRGFRGESSSTQPLTLFMGEFPLPCEILLSLLSILKSLMLNFLRNKIPQKKIDICHYVDQNGTGHT